MESTGNRRNSFCLDGRRQPSLGWHEPDESRGLRPDLWEARGEIPRAYPARGNRTKSNRTEAAWRKPRQSPPGGYRHCASSRLYSEPLPEPFGPSGNKRNRRLCKRREITTTTPI